MSLSTIARSPWKWVVAVVILLSVFSLGVVKGGRIISIDADAFMRLAPWLLCGLIGALTGMVELLQRYSRGTPPKLLVANVWAITYLAVNTVVALLAYLMVFLDAVPGFHLSVVTRGEQFAAASIAGIGGMVLLRSALMSIRTDDRDYPVGFGLLLDVLREQIDHRLDQARAISCSTEVFEIMRNVDPVKAAVSLAPLALQLLERTSEKTQQEVDKEIEAILQTHMPNKTKSMLIGVAIQKIAGIDVLRHAAANLGDEITLSVQNQEVGGASNGPVDSWDIIKDQLSGAREQLLRSGSAGSA